MLGEWKKRGIDTHISVNVSPKDFCYLDIYSTFMELVKRYDIEPERLNIEITETTLMSDIPNLMSDLDRLRKAGFAIEIDDFGSGYSSLNTLKDIDADALKIDMGFLRETENVERSRVILNSIINMAKELGMPVITEGVETAEQVDALTGMGCDMFQGYYYSKPIKAEEFEDKYIKQNKQLVRHLKE